VSQQVFGFPGATDAAPSDGGAISLLTHAWVWYPNSRPAGSSDPAKPMLGGRVCGPPDIDDMPADVPAETQIWLPYRNNRSSPHAELCPYCLMNRATKPSPA
jgi:hypothetical protein